MFDAISRILSCLSIFGLLCFTACTNQTAQVVPSSSTPSRSAPVQNQEARIGLIQVNSIYIAPVKLGVAVGSKDFHEEALTGIVNQSIKEELDFEVLTSDDAKKRGIAGTDSVSSIALKLETDAILVTRLEHIAERNGNAVAADAPAAIAFSMSVERISDGKAVWQGSYSFYDKALSDNLFKLGAKNKSEKVDQTKGWASASQLFNQGVHDLARKLQRARQDAYTAH